MTSLALLEQHSNKAKLVKVNYIQKITVLKFAIWLYLNKTVNITKSISIYSDGLMVSAYLYPYLSIYLSNGLCICIYIYIYIYIWTGNQCVYVLRSKSQTKNSLYYVYIYKYLNDLIALIDIYIYIWYMLKVFTY